MPLTRTIAELLADPEATAAPRAVIPRLAYRGRVTLVAAREKAGKSTVLTAGAAAVTRGTAFLGGICAKGVVLWVTADQEHAGDIVQRATRFNADPDTFFVNWPTLGFPDILKEVERLSPVLVIVDTLSNYARVKDPFSSAEWVGVLLPLVRLAREKHVAMVVLHHTVKAEGGGYRDSTAIGATVDLILEMKRNGTKRSLSGSGRWHVEPFTIEMKEHSFELVDGTLRERIITFVSATPNCSQKDIREAMNARYEDVSKELLFLMQNSQIADVGYKNHGKYALNVGCSQSHFENEQKT